LLAGDLILSWRWKRRLEGTDENPRPEGVLVWRNVLLFCRRRDLRRARVFAGQRRQDGAGLFSAAAGSIAGAARSDINGPFGCLQPRAGSALSDLAAGGECGRGMPVLRTHRTAGAPSFAFGGDSAVGVGPRAGPGGGNEARGG